VTHERPIHANAGSAAPLDEPLFGSSHDGDINNEVPVRMQDVVMIALVLAAFAGAAAYVLACVELTRPPQPPKWQSDE
jgi:hypothetical protein